VSRSAAAYPARLTTPRPQDLRLRRIHNVSGLVFSRLPNGGLFALEHAQPGGRIMLNRGLGSPLAGGLERLWLRIGGSEPRIVPIAGAQARARIGAAERRFLWHGATDGVRHEVSLQLHPRRSLWLWQVEVANTGVTTLPCDSVLLQDLGLGDLHFLMNNEAYASQYLDHHIAPHPRFGPVLMARQNLPQNGRHPWVAHGCLTTAAGFATDFLQLLGPAHRDADGLAIPFGESLPSRRLQHETGCAALQSAPARLAPGESARWTFFGLFCPDHPSASADTDLALIEESLPSRRASFRRAGKLAAPARSVLQDSAAAVAAPLAESELSERYPRSSHHEGEAAQPLSLFAPVAPDDTLTRHVVLRDKERQVVRRHGAVLRSGTSLLPDETTLCVTCWMHGVFGAQLAIGNTSFHRLLSVSRDPYNIGRGSGLRILFETHAGWRLLTVPSAFEIGLADCRWIYRFDERTLTVTLRVSPEEPAAAWQVRVDGEPCRLLIFGHLSLGEREFEQAARVEIDPGRKGFSFRPDPNDIWGRHYPRSLYRLVASTPGAIEATGGDELLYADGARRSGAYVAMRTHPTRELAFAVVGSLTDPARAEALAERFRAKLDAAAMDARSARFWCGLTRGLRLEGADSGARVALAVGAVETMLPWLAHDALVHLTVPQGLEQYSGAAWGTRDVCQGPIEMLLALGHDAPARAVLLRLFAEQFAPGGDWPQWFMLAPYSDIRDSQAHGDVIIWPLKALCDYLETTGDFAILDEPLPWRERDSLQPSATADPLVAHVERLLNTVRARFVPGTQLLSYGNGDWNDSLQPVDAAMRERMVSSWTVALLYQQLCRYAAIAQRAGRSDGAAERRLAEAVREDFNRWLVRDGVVAGYAIFGSATGPPELLFHPRDQRTGVRYSLLPMVQAISGGLFTPEQVQQHLQIIRGQLTFPDGVRLLERPLAYHGGPQTLFQRAESAAFFGREIGLMYTHAHLRYAQAMAVLAEADALWDALLIVNPIAVTERLAHASLRQRNTYFSSSDAAFADRYLASSDWPQVRAATIAVDGGWRMYSSGPGLYLSVLVCQALGQRRLFGAPVTAPCLPEKLRALRLEWSQGSAPGSPPQ